MSNSFFIATYHKKRNFNLETQVSVDHEGERMHIKFLRQEKTSRDIKTILVMQIMDSAGVIINPGQGNASISSRKGTVWSLPCLDFLSALALLLK